MAAKKPGKKKELAPAPPDDDAKLREALEQASRAIETFHAERVHVGWSALLDDDEQWRSIVTREIKKLGDIMGSMLTVSAGLSVLMAKSEMVELGRLKRMQTRLNKLEKKRGMVLSKPPDRSSFTDSLDAYTKIALRLLQLALALGKHL